ncbi:MAG: DUF5916 domain-containing protein [Clostridiales bacterium]|nr:DUF5916 domain-containing protein [Clostridiales bacterium]
MKKRELFTRTIRLFNLFAVAAVLASAIAAAPLLEASISAQKPKEPLVVPKFDTPPNIDGVVNDAVWEKGLKFENFVQYAPKENGTPTQKTTAWMGYDTKNLYIAFRCDDTEAGKIRASVTNRDNAMDDDWILVFLDTFNEKRRASSFFLNPIGVQMDMIRVEEGGNDNFDNSWDTVWESEGRVDEGGYTVEMAIPFKSLRFPDAATKTWGLVLGRNIPRSGEIILWPSFSRQIPGLLTQGGEIVIPGAVERGRNLEIMPVATSLKREGKSVDFEPGVNLKYGLKSDLTLDATLNPDFSHIEADAPQIDVNLRFALRYPEKRPFFLEGMEIFKFPEIEMVYTRRIIDPLWGVKASGKIGRFAYGILSAQDQHPSESLWDIHNGGTPTDDQAWFNIVRLKTDVFKESYIGFCLADKEINRSWNRVGGVDGQWRFANKFFFSFQALASKTNRDGDPTPVAPALYAEAFYFTKHWTAGGYWKSIHPDFEAASGFVNRTDFRTAGAFTSASIYPDKKFLNQIRVNLNAGRRLDYFSPAVQDTWVRFQTQLRFTEFNQAFIMVENGLEKYAGTDFRKTTLYVESQSNILRRMPFSLFVKIGDAINYDPDDPFLGWGVTFGGGTNFKPSSRLQIGVDFSKSSFWREAGGERLWDFNVIRTRTAYQLTKSLSVRAILDYNHYYREIFGSFLVSYILRPGTVFFLGFDSNYDKPAPGPYARRDYSVFLKFSYWWRL